MRAATAAQQAAASQTYAGDGRKRRSGGNSMASENSSAVHAAAKPGEVPTGTHDAMARHDEAQRVMADSAAYRAGGLPAAGFALDALGDVAVRRRATIGDVQHGLADAQLELGRAGAQRQLMRVGSLAGEIAVEPRTGFHKHRQVVRTFHRAVHPDAEVAVVIEPATDDRLTVACQRQRTDDRRLVNREVRHGCLLGLPQF